MSTHFGQQQLASIAVIGFLPIENRDQFGKVAVRGAVIGFKCSGQTFCHFIRHPSQWLAGPQCFNVCLSRPLEIVQPVERLGDGITNDQDAMVAHDHHLTGIVRKHFCTPFSLIR